MIVSRIIGHRGAAGLALENTLTSFRKAIEAGTTIIEFDVQTTSDGHFVICHDNDLSRVSDSRVKIKDVTLKTLRDIPLKNGDTVPLLTEALDLVRKHNITAVVEAKTISDTEAFCALLDTYRDVTMAVASFNHALLARIRKLRPDFALYLGESHQPIAVLQKAKAMKAQGIDLHYMLMNPLTYWLAQLWELELMLYTPNQPGVVRLLRFLYPRAYVCTDFPNRFVHLPQSR